MGSMSLIRGLQDYTKKCIPFSVFQIQPSARSNDTGARVAHKSGLLIEDGPEELFPDSWFWSVDKVGRMLRNESQGLFGVSKCAIPLVPERDLGDVKMRELEVSKKKRNLSKRWCRQHDNKPCVL